LLRPARIIALSPRWNDHEVVPGGVIRALYVLDGSLNVLVPLRFTYGNRGDDSWRDRLAGFEAGLARARGRAAADRN
jgi:hypothetical protein